MFNNINNIYVEFELYMKGESGLYAKDYFRLFWK